MGRQAREYSSTGFYHVVFRGINHQHIFEESSDYDYMLEIVRQLKAEMAFEVHAYCLMSNHVHLLLREKKMGHISLGQWGRSFFVTHGNSCKIKSRPRVVSETMGTFPFCHIEVQCT